MVDDLRMTFVFKHYLCVMFAFQLGFLHISKDVLYESNNLVSSSLYQIPTTSSQGHQWVVACGCYRIVGYNLTHNFQDNIFTLRTTSFVVKIVKDEHKVLDTLPQCSNIFASSFFIELSNSSSSDDLTPSGFLMR